MFLVQVLFIIFILAIIARLLIRLKKAQIGVGGFLAWLVFWAVAGVIIVWPEATSYLARQLGVGRGADVIIYFSLILIFYFIFYFTVKLRIIERNIAKIVRKISLEDKDKNHTTHNIKHVS